MRAVPVDLVRLAGEQDRVVALHQALAAGLTPDAVRHRVESGQWRRLARGVYYLHAGAVPLRARCRAAVLVTAGRAVISHVAAGHLYRLDALPPSARVDVTVRSPEPRRSSALIRAHRADLDREEWGWLAGLPVTSPGRTCLDLARTQGRLIAVRATESAWSQGYVDRAQLLGLAERARGWPGVRRFRAAVTDADHRSESLLETAGRLVLRRAGLTGYDVQLVIYDEYGRLLARVDLAWPAEKLAVEFDGHDPHAGRAAFRHDRRRQNALVNRGWLVLRFSWEDVFGRPAYVVQDVRRALAVRHPGAVSGVA